MKRTFTPSALTLGTVQLGLPYGLGQSGLISEDEAEAILDSAYDGGIRQFDTARAYGVSEERIGQWLKSRRHPDIRIATKAPALAALPPSERGKALAASLQASIAALGRRPLDLVLAHGESDLLQPDIADAYLAAIQDGSIAAFGASVYSTAIALQLLESDAVAALQVPASAVDRRFAQAGVFAKAAERNVTVFVRSVFLQGALLMPAAKLPPHLSLLSQPLHALQSIADRLHRSLPELLMAAVRDIPGAHSIVVGVDRADQLAAHLRAVQSPRLATEIRSEIFAAVGILPEDILDPSQWPHVKT